MNAVVIDVFSVAMVIDVKAPAMVADVFAQPIVIEMAPQAPANGGTSGGSSGGSTSSPYSPRATVGVSNGAVDLPDVSTALVQMTQNVTSIVFTPWAHVPRRMIVYFQQDAVGGRTLSGWPADVVWPDAAAPVLSSKPNAIDCFVFDTVDGSILFGNLVGAGYGPAM